jgi:hypothetical protein
MPLGLMARLFRLRTEVSGERLVLGGGRSALDQHFHDVATSRLSERCGANEQCHRHDENLSQSSH